MKNSSFAQPSPELLSAFVAGDPLAEDEVIRIILPQLFRWAISKHPGLDPADIQSVIHQVITETCRPIVRYDPNKSKITTYLINLINLRLKDLYTSDIEFESIDTLEPNQREKSSGSLYNTVDTSTSLTRQSFFDELITLLTPLEQDFLALIRTGEKNQIAFVRLLQIYETVSDPEREVKNIKVRLIRKLKTLAQTMNYELEDLIDY